MDKEKYTKKGLKQHRTFRKKSLILVFALLLLIGGVIGGTIAWLTASPTTITNIFSASNIEVTLTETTSTYKMVPGLTISKDPKVRVSSESEDCYVFIKVEKQGTASYNFDTFINYKVDTGVWTKLEHHTVSGEVYYKLINSTYKNVDLPILVHPNEATNYNKVLVKDTVTKAMMDEVTTEVPYLKFTVSAIQYKKSDAENFTALEAWTALQ